MRAGDSGSDERARGSTFYCSPPSSASSSKRVAPEIDQRRAPRPTLTLPELHLRGGHVLVPDLAGWRRERMPELSALWAR